MAESTRDTWSCPDCGLPWPNSLREAEAIDWQSVAEFVRTFHTSTGICTGLQPTADQIRAHALRTAKDVADG